MVFVVKLIWILTVALITMSCESLQQELHNAPSPVVHLPVHTEPLVTDWGRHHIMGELIIDNGCLRVLGDPGPNGPTPSYLLIWPEGYALNRRGDVINSEGLVAPAVGDNVRFSGRLVREESYNSERLASNIPHECAGPYYIIGDEVSIVEDETTELSLPGHVTAFKRKETVAMVPGWSAYVPVPWGPSGELVLRDGCLLLHVNQDGREELRVIVWPPGFQPALGDEGMVIRNGGGNVVAQLGDTLKMTMLTAGGDSEGAYVPECNARLWEAQRVSNDGLPTTLLRHNQSPSGSVVLPGEQYSRMMVDEDFRSSHRRTELEVINGCTYAGNGILVWPPGFGIKQDEHGAVVVDQNGEEVAREGEDVVLKVRSVHRDDLLGREMVNKTPPNCGGYFLFVGH